MQSLKTGKNRALRVGVTTSGGYLFPRLLNAFTARQSGIEFELTVRPRDELVRMLEVGDLDLAAMGNAPEREDMAVSWFAPHDYVVVASPCHPLAGQTGLDAGVLSSECFFTRERGTDTRSETTAALGGVIAPAKLREIGCTEAIKQSVMAGMGLSLLSAHTVQLELLTGRMVTLDIVGFPVRRGWNLVWSTSVSLSPVANAFREYLKGVGADLLSRCLARGDTGRESVRSARTVPLPEARPSTCRAQRPMRLHRRIKRSISRRTNFRHFAPGGGARRVLVDSAV
jgi:DNA-binding transcriptional LysR family regulator